MASKLNHHFVPQYLFRQFSGGQRYIHLISKRSSDVIFRASVRGQCARRKFYGSPELEDVLAVYDGRHSIAFRAVIREAWSQSPTGLSEDELYWLFEGLMLQRGRVPRAADNLADGSEKTLLYAFREFVKASPDDGMRDRIVAGIDSGKVTLKEHYLATLLHSLKMAIDSVIAITDLNIAVLRNHTKYPFVFGDSPCVFFNRYLYHCKTRGVLGYLTPGLMILMPLDSRTQVVLYDPATYQIRGGGDFIDVIEKSDASQLNALQLYSAKQNVYFACCDDADYLGELISCHRPNFTESHSEFRVWPPGTILIDGEPNKSEVVHTFESQLPIRLDLSFVDTKPAPKDDSPQRARSPDIRKELQEMMDKDLRGLPIEQLAAELKPELEGLPEA